MHLKVGDLIFVELSYSSQTRPWWASRYNILTDEIPAGFSVVEQDDKFRGAPYHFPIRVPDFQMRKIFDDHVSWYFQVGRGLDASHRLGYVLRADFAGEFTTGIAKIEDFYDETQYSQAPAVRVAVDAAGTSESGQ